MTDTTQARLDGSVKTLVGICQQDSTDSYVGRGDHGAPSQQHADWRARVAGESLPGRRAECIELFREDFETRLEGDAEFRDAVADLAGQTLGCWCQRLEDDGPGCHGSVIAEATDRLAAEGTDE